MRKMVVCDRCHKLVRADAAHMEAPLTLCKACVKAHYAYCAGCGCFAERELLHWPYGVKGGLCDECFARYCPNNHV